MAAGNVVAGTSSVAATTGTFDIKPSSGNEWVIHNLYAAGSSVNLVITDGTNTIQFDTINAGDARLGLTTHVTNGYWLRITNTTGTAATIAYDGIQTT